MSTEDRIERARLAWERAIYVGDVDALAAAERELNAVEGGSRCGARPGHAGALPSAGH
jgi:hypothetical protein